MQYQLHRIAAIKGLSDFLGATVDQALGFQIHMGTDLPGHGHSKANEVTSK